MKINDHDVVSMDAAKSLIGLETFKVSQLPAGLKERWGTNAIEQWLTEGIDCEVLGEAGGGWRKGKIRLCFEFTPDTSNALVPPPPPRSAISDRTPIGTAQQKAAQW